MQHIYYNKNFIIYMNIKQPLKFSLYKKISIKKAIILYNNFSYLRHICTMKIFIGKILVSKVD